MGEMAPENVTTSGTYFKTRCKKWMSASAFLSVEQIPLTWKKSYMKSQTILIYKKIYLDLQQKAEVFIFHYFFFH